LYWGPDPSEFKRERFVDTETYRWPRDACKPAFTNHPSFAFSGGPRSCIGQRFTLALAAKPIERQRRELLKWKPGVTITPRNCRVRLRRR
ncbi:hypothetical protein B0H17DRAFT_888382, partial [Mycena rosella]